MILLIRQAVCYTDYRKWGTQWIILYLKTAQRYTLEGFIKKIGLSTTLSELGIKDKSILPEIDASCNASPGIYSDMNTKKILNILNECF